MACETISELLQGLEINGLLNAQQLDELRHRPEAAAEDFSGLRLFLQQSRWLTRYQFDLVREGRGEQLTFAGYRILNRIKENESGIKMVAFHPALQEPIILRWVNEEWLQPADNLSEYLDRARQATLVSHPRLVNVLDAGYIAGKLFIVQEYVDGVDLAFLVNDMGALPINLACEYIREAAEAMHAAHERDLVHPDLHPAQLLLTPVKRYKGKLDPKQHRFRPRPGARVQVHKLGLLPRRPAIMDVPVGQNHLLPHIDYQPPERLFSAEVTVRTNIYNLGASLYFLLTAQSPLGVNKLIESMLKLQQQEPRPIRELRSDIPASLGDLVQRMIAKDPQKRPESLVEVQEILKKFSFNLDRPLKEKPKPVLTTAPVTAESQSIPMLIPVWVEEQPDPPSEIEDNLPLWVQYAQEEEPPPEAQVLPSQPKPIFEPMVQPDTWQFSENYSEARDSHPHLFPVEDVEDVAQEPLASKRTSSVKSSGRKTWLWIVLGGLLHLSAVIILLWALGFLGSKSETSPSEKEKASQTKPGKTNK